MCGIVAAASHRNVVPILMDGLNRLEYRGYDSAGIALTENNKILRIRKQGKVAELHKTIKKEKNFKSPTGVAHTRWATHGEPSEINAHPHVSGDDYSNSEIALVHNGIIENFADIREKLIAEGYIFSSKTDSEVIVHLIHLYRKDHDLMGSVARATNDLVGDFAITVIEASNPDAIVGARQGCPLIIGVGLDENYFASDAGALIALTSRFVILKDGDVAQITAERFSIFNQELDEVERKITTSNMTASNFSKEGYRHFMEKEIFEQPEVVRRAYGDYITGAIKGALFEKSNASDLGEIKHIQICACGTSYYAALVAKLWIEHFTRIPTSVDIGSEYRYNTIAKQKGSLFIAISQSGETADTLAALRKAKEKNYIGTIAICNVLESSLAREADRCLPTSAGPEIGVASTKAFVSQLVSVALLGLTLGDSIGFSKKAKQQALSEIKQLPELIEAVLNMSGQIEELAWALDGRNHILFLGRGLHYPIALEGALKMKEISYVHAEAYPAGELKHGPLALVDEDMPVIAIAPSGQLLQKIMSNLEEVRARGGQLFVLADDENITKNGFEKSLILPSGLTTLQSPVVYTIPLQLLAYFVALHKGNDVDQPRNLAKSVTVE
jgi:glucosamine--fructose-6-phosphate aminotransferase (isomerizing)